MKDIILAFIEILRMENLMKLEKEFLILKMFMEIKFKQFS